MKKIYCTKFSNKKMRGRREHNRSQIELAFRTTPRKHWPWVNLGSLVGLYLGTLCPLLDIPKYMFYFPGQNRPQSSKMHF